MAKIIGDTTVTPMPVPDLAQTDERKADYIKNKKVSYLENDIGYAEKTYVDNKVGEIDEALESFIDNTKVTMHFLDADNTLYTAKINTWMTWAEAIETEEVKALGMGFTIGDDGYVRCYLSAFIKKADYEGDVSASTFPAWCIKGTDKVKDGQIYISSGVYEMDIPSGGGGTWETIADITIPDGFASYSYTITSATYPDMAKITDFYIAMTVPKQSDGAISGALQVQLEYVSANIFLNVARFETWNHASYIMKGFVFSKLYGDKRHNQFYGFSANATQGLENKSLLNGLDLDYFNGINIALSDASKTLPAGMTIKIVGCKK